jgi:xanthine dehydrogenase YagR molybdenum-binding subunit
MQQSTFGAHFVEVGVDALTGEVRVRRHAGGVRRRPNPQSEISAQPGDRRDDDGCRAPLDGRTGVDKRFGYFVNHDIAEYEVPVHADIPQQEVIFLDETDPTSRRR